MSAKNSLIHIICVMGTSVAQNYKFCVYLVYVNRGGFPLTLINTPKILLHYVETFANILYPILK